MSVFNCATYDALRLFLKGELTRDGDRSIRQTALAMGYASPNALMSILRGERLAGSAFVRRVSSFLQLSTTETAYVSAMFEYERKRRAGDDLDETLGTLHLLNPETKDQDELSESEFKLISDWRHLPLKALVETSDFHPSPEWIAQRMRGKLTATQIRRSLEVLTFLGLIERVGGKRKYRVARNIRTSRDLPNSAIKRHHHEMMSRAQEALHEQNVKKRDISSSTFVIENKKIDEAKRVIDEFRETFRKRFEKENGDEVAQLNLQFFLHTDR